MASSMRLIVTVSILLGSCLSRVNADYNKYVSLITDVSNEYSTPTVFFTFSRSNPRMQEYTMAHSLTRDFSNQRIHTLITHFDRLNDRLDYYRKRMSRPLVFILLKSLENIDEFKMSIRDIDKSYPIWLVIFHGNYGDEFCEQCRRPLGNMFGLRFDTLMLVLCCDNLILEEWWSVHGNSTEIGNFGTWKANERLKLSTTHGLNARRHNVDGTGLRIIVVANSGNGVGGFFGEVLDELRHAMNFTIVTLHAVESFGTYNATTNSWSGAIGMLVERKADIAVSDFGMIESRLRAIDFTTPLYMTRTKLYIRDPENIGTRWFAYFEAFSSKIWVILVVITITTPLLLIFITTKRGSESMCSLYLEYVLIVWGILCQQGLLNSPRKTPTRIAYSSIFVLAFVVSAAYSAMLISFLTVTSSSLPFTDLVGFIEHGSHRVIVNRYTSEYEYLFSSTDPIIKQLSRLMKPWNDLPRSPAEGWKQVCKENVAFFATYVQRATTKSQCKIVGIDTGRVVSFAIALPAGSQYKNVVNYHIQRFKTNGMFTRLRTIYYNKDRYVDPTYEDVEFSRVLPILLILTGGIILAVIALICEIMYFSRDNGAGRWCSREKKSQKTKSFESRERDRFLTGGARLRPPLRASNIDLTFIEYCP